jgi:hypothetical protein
MYACISAAKVSLIQSLEAFLMHSIFFATPAPVDHETATRRFFSAVQTPSLMAASRFQVFATTSVLEIRTERSMVLLCDAYGCCANVCPRDPAKKYTM